jgi:X-Pro dipeptidyl-peptidase
VFLQPGANAGTLGLAPAPGDPGTTTFTDSRTQTEATAMVNPTTVTANRRVFLSPVLKAPVRVSGTPVVQLDASANKTETHFGALLVDYGPAFPRVNTRTADGVRTDTTSDCWGESSDVDSACFKDVDEIVDTTTTNWMVSRGVLDAQHRWTEDVQTPIVAGQTYPFSWQLLPQDYTFPAGHQIGIVIEGSDRDWTTADTNAAAITLSLKSSRVSLPVVGGGEALRQAGLAAGEGTSVSVAQDSAQTNDAAPVKLTATVSADDPVMDPEALPDYQQRYLPQGEWAGFTQLGTPTGSVQFLDGGQPLGAPVPLTGGVATSTVTLAGGAHQISAAYLGDGGFDASASPAITHTVGLTSTVGGTVPATLALTLGGPAGFGAFTPGVTADYTASTTATVISTAGDAQLSVADPDTAHPGRLVNGAFALASPVRARAAGAPFADVGASPLALLGWDGPIANAVVPLDFHQHVAATDPLRTGTYAKTLTFTLSTTTP